MAKKEKSKVEENLPDEKVLENAEDTTENIEEKEINAENIVENAEDVENTENEEKEEEENTENEKVEETSKVEENIESHKGNSLKVVEGFNDKYHRGVTYYTNDILIVKEKPNANVKKYSDHKEYEISIQRAEELKKTSYVEEI